MWWTNLSVIVFVNKFSSHYKISSHEGLDFDWHYADECCKTARLVVTFFYKLSLGFSYSFIDFWPVVVVELMIFWAKKRFTNLEHVWGLWSAVWKHMQQSLQVLN